MTLQHEAAMEWTISFPRRGPFDVEVTTSGEHTVEGEVAWQRELATDPRYRPGLNILVDQTASDFSSWTSEDVRRSAELADEVVSSTGGAVGYTAVVCPTSLAYGINRMWQAFADEQFFGRVRIVWSLAEAYEWLEAQPAATRANEANR